MKRLVQRFREEAERIGFAWAFGFMTGYITAMFEHGRAKEPPS